MRFFLLFSILFSTMLFGELNWASNYTKAFELAAQQKKGVMVMLSQENCKACWYMENIVLDDETIVQTIGERFVPLYLDIHKDDIHGLTFRGTPTLYFLETNGQTIKRLDGVLNIKELSTALQTIETGKQK